MEIFFNQIFKYKNTILLLFIVFIFIGIHSITKLAVDAVPDISPVQILINTKTGGLDPEQIEKTVTYKIESEIAGIQGIKEIRSISKFGLSQVITIFEDHTNIYQARQLLSEKLQAIRSEIPYGLSPELGPISTGLGEVFMYVLLPKKGSELELKTNKEQLTYLRTIHDYFVRPYLKSHIKNIADIDSQGGYKRELHIDFIPNQLNHYGITIDDIITRLGIIGENIGGGYIEKNDKQIILRTLDQMNITNLKNIPIKLSLQGKKITLSDIAYIREDSKQRVGAATYNGKEAVLGTVLMLMGSNSRDVAIHSEEAVKLLKLPKDVTLKIVYSRKEIVNQTLYTLFKSLSEGAVLVIIILFFFIGNIRAALIVSLSIPLSLLGALIGMEKLGISANLMSLGAIDFGVLADGSIVIVENLIRKLNESPNKFITIKEKINFIINSCKEVSNSVILGLIIIMIVYVPILSLEGVEGKMFYPMAMSILIALFTSLIIAIILIPILCYIFIKKESFKKNHDPKLFQILQKIYLPILNYSLSNNKKNKIILIAISCIFFFSSLVLVSKMGSNFIPPLDEGDMVINVTQPNEFSLDKTLRLQNQIETSILSFQEVKFVFSRMGTPESATDPMGQNLVDTFVILKPKNQWRKIDGEIITKYTLFKEIYSKISLIAPDADIVENQPIAMRLNEVLEGSRADVSLRIYGKDLNTLEKLQSQLIPLLEPIEGVKEVSLDALTALRKNEILNLKLDYNKMNLYNVHNSDIYNTIKFSFIGEEIGAYYEYDWRFPIILKMAEEFRNDTHEILKTPITLSEMGETGSVPLGKVANFISSNNVVSIARSNAQRYTGVSIYLQNKDLLSFIEEAKVKIHKNIKLDDGYELEWGGQFKNLESAKRKFLIIIPLTLIVIFILLYRNFYSLKLTLLIYLSIPFALTGGVFAIYLRNIDLSVSVMIGFIALSGIVILNGMILLSFIKKLHNEGYNLYDAVKEGAMMRLRPVFMTALVATLGFLPMAFNTGIGAEVQRPLATVVIGGLISSTILTLIILPMLYFITNKNKQ